MDIDPDRAKQFKIILIGATAVGKTSLVTRFTQGRFSPSLNPTVTAAFVSKSVPYMDSRITLNIWDTAGLEEYRSIVPLYFQLADAGILVYDVTCLATFQEVDGWLQELREKSDNDPVLALVANKSDLAEANRAVPAGQGDRYAKGQGIHLFMETSACTGDNVLALFDALIARLTPRLASVTETASRNDLSGQTALKNCC
jgi:Ras-related protein Rab-5C